uniref:uncharacterized protein LOC122587824 n=1 Tax=Erigeron canadensis TaxID=72917 RepID=UPI001CB988FA|nr:uncharacterized protein LOC122587824 [Erigeron canadensis]
MPLIETEDLSAPYCPTSASKFTKRISDFQFPSKIKMPSNVKMYDGTTDPDDHMGVFSGAAKVEQWSMPVWCHMFGQTLFGSARVWYDSLARGSIDSFEELRQKFLTHFMVQQKYTRNPVEVHNIRQRENESLTAFMERYNLESMRILGASETMRVLGFMHGIRSKQLIEKLNTKVPDTVKEMMEVVKAHIRAKEAIIAAKLDEAPARRNNKQSRQFNNRRAYTSSTERSERHQNTPYSPANVRRHEHDTALIKTLAEILATEYARVGFIRPQPMMGDPNKRNAQYCEFHSDKGHHTNDCWQL